MQWFRRSLGLLGLALVAAAAPLLAQDDTTVTAEAFRTVNVRSGPGTDYAVINRLDRGEVVEVLGRSDPASDWLFIESNGETGWIAYFTVAVKGETGILPIVSAETPPTTPPQSIPQVEAQAFAPSPTPTHAPVPTGEAFVSAYRTVNVRSGPSTNYAILGVLAPGERAAVTGRGGTDNQWLQIDFNGRDGWVAFYVVNVSGDLRSVAPAPATTGADVDTQVVILTRFNTNLRAEPRLNAAVLAVVPYEAELRAEARTADSAWVQVTYEDQTGWLIASLLTIVDGSIVALPAP
jgi:uncharacterized protein YraI